MYTNVPVAAMQILSLAAHYSKVYKATLEGFNKSAKNIQE